jgi:fermentation-respiration switch protein FrsA (DUF1100 family)
MVRTDGLGRRHRCHSDPGIEQRPRLLRVRLHVSRGGQNLHFDRAKRVDRGLQSCLDVPYYNSPVLLGHAFSLWTPTAPGEHTLMAYQTSAGGPVETVTVTPGTPIGPVCLVAP